MLKAGALSAERAFHRVQDEAIPEPSVRVAFRGFNHSALNACRKESKSRFGNVWAYAGACFPASFVLIRTSSFTVQLCILRLLNSVFIAEY